MSYNKIWIDALNIKNISRKLRTFKLIGDEQLHLIEDLNKEHFYTPNLFVRIGLFVFTFILANAALGIVGMSVAAAFNNESAFGVLCLLAASILFFTLNFFIKTKYHFRSGIDDCLLFMAVFFTIAGFALITDFSNPKMVLMLSLPVLIFTSWKYLDRVMAVLAFICLLTLIFLVAADFGWGKMLMPFIIFFIASAVTYFAYRLYKNDKFVYWEHVINSLKIAGLICVYLSMNYFVVREGNILLNETTLATPTSAEYMAIQLKIDENQVLINNSYSDSSSALSETELTRLNNQNSNLYDQLYAIEKAELESIRAQSVPMSWIFILLTIIFPVIYVSFGLMKRDRILLLTGLAILVFSVFTYKYYNQLYPLEYSITFIGIVLLAAAWTGIRYLKSNNTKFTYDPENETDNQDLLNAEAFMVSQTVTQPGNASEPGTGFGGGSFGGGGAGGSL